jgi:chromosome segregation ATPase
MKLKFVLLGLLGLSIMACESYDESKSVEEMRKARTEYVQAETALKIAQAAYQEAMAKAKEIENAFAEAANAVELESLRVELEEAKARLEAKKVELEKSIVEQQKYIHQLEDELLSNAYNNYVLAYSGWEKLTFDLLDKESDLGRLKHDLAEAKLLDENWTPRWKSQLESASVRLKSELEELKTSLTTYEDLKTNNEWEDVLIKLEDKKVQLAEIEAELNNKTVEFDIASDSRNQAVKALMDWASENYISSPIVSGEGIVKFAADFNTHKAKLATDTIAPYNEMVAAKTALSIAKPTDAGYNVLQENYNVALNNYNEAIAEYKAYNESVLKSQLAALNSTYIATDAKVELLNDQLSTIEGKKDAVRNEVNNLGRLQFTIETMVYNQSYVKNALDNMIENTKNTINQIEEDIIRKAEDLTKIESGDYDLAQAVRDVEKDIAKIEFEIANLTSKVETAKSKLDAAEAKYKALLDAA